MNKVMTKNIDIIKSAIEKYGETSQIIKTIEELSELQKELCKFINTTEYNRTQIVDEMSDVMIMIKQTRLIFNISKEELEKQIQYKLDRLKDRLNYLTGLTNS